jgi:hypothetical protein
MNKKLGVGYPGRSECALIPYKKQTGNIHRGGSHGKMEAEIKVMQPTPKNA